MTPHENYQTVLKTHVDIGDLKSIEVKYMETSNIIKVIFSNDWKLESLKVFQGSQQKT